MIHCNKYYVNVVSPSPPKNLIVWHLPSHLGMTGDDKMPMR